MAKNVLVATPQAAFGELIRMSLEESGNYEVRLVQTAAEARTNLPRKNYVLTILDSGLLDESVVNLSQAFMAQNPDLRIILIPPDNNPDHPLLKGFTPHGLLSQPFYMPDLIQMADQILGFIQPDPDGAGQNGDGDEPEELPQWVLDTSQAGAYLAHLLKETTARAALLSRKGKVYSQAGDLDEKSTNELAAQLVRYWDGGDRSDLARFMKLQYSGEHFIYARVVNPELVLALVYAPSQPIQKSRLQVGTMRRTILHTPPPAEVLEAAHPAEELVAEQVQPAVPVEEAAPVIEQPVPQAVSPEPVVEEAAIQAAQPEAELETATAEDTSVADWLEALPTAEAINERMPVVDDFLTEVAPQANAAVEEEPLLNLRDNIFQSSSEGTSVEPVAAPVMEEAEEEAEPQERAAIVSDLPLGGDEFDETETIQVARPVAEPEPEYSQTAQEIEPEPVEAVSQEKDDFQKRLIDELGRLGDRKPAAKPIELEEIPQAVEPPTKELKDTDFDAFDMAAVEKTPLMKEEPAQEQTSSDDRRLEEAIARAKSARLEKAAAESIPPVPETPTKELKDTDFEAFDMGAVEKTPIPRGKKAPEPEAAEPILDEEHLTLELARREAARLSGAPGVSPEPITKELKEADFEAFDMSSVEKSPLPKEVPVVKPRTAPFIMPPKAAEPPTKELAQVDFNPLDFEKLERTPTEPLPEPPVAPPDSKVRPSKAPVQSQAEYEIPKAVEPPTKELTAMDFDAFDVSSAEKEPVTQPKVEPQKKGTAARDRRLAALREEVPVPENRVPTKELTEMDFDAFDLTATEVSSLSNQQPSSEDVKPPTKPPKPQEKKIPTADLAAMDFNALDFKAAEIVKSEPESAEGPLPESQRLGGKPRPQLQPMENQVPTRELDRVDFEAFDMSATEVTKAETSEPAPKRKTSLESLRLGGKPRPQLQPQDNQMPTRELDKVDFGAFDVKAAEVSELKKEVPSGHESPFVPETPPAKPAEKPRTTSPFLESQRKKSQPLTPMPDPPTKDLDSIDFKAVDTSKAEVSPASRRRKPVETDELRVPTKDLTGDMDFEALDVSKAQVEEPEPPKPQKGRAKGKVTGELATTAAPKLPDDLIMKPFEVPSPSDVASRANPDHEELLEEPLPELDSWLQTLPTPADVSGSGSEEGGLLPAEDAKLADMLANMPPPDPQKSPLQGMGEWMPAAQTVNDSEQFSLRDLVLPGEEEKEDIDDESMPTSPLKIVSQHIEETKDKTAPLRSRSFTGQLGKGKGAIPVGTDVKKTQPLKAVPQVNFFTFLLVPDHPKQFLSGNVGKWLEQEIARICEGNNWKFDKIITKPEHLIVIMETPANIPVEEVVAEIRNKTSAGLFKRFNDLKTLEPGGDFWAHRELITDGNQQPARETIKSFVTNVRQAQGY